MPYAIIYSEDIGEHLDSITARERAIVFEAIEQQLMHQPDVVTRNRKPMRPNPVAPWELRSGDLRIYYRIETEPEPIVRILAIGKKEHEKVFIGGREVKL